MSHNGVAPDGVYTACYVTVAAVSSYLAFSSLPAKPAVIFCCTFLEVTFTGCYPAPLPCGARTFLRYNLSVYTRDRQAYLLFYYIKFVFDSKEKNNIWCKTYLFSETTPYIVILRKIIFIHILLFILPSYATSVPPDTLRHLRIPKSKQAKAN